MPKPAYRDRRGVIITALALTAAAVPLATAALGLAGALGPHHRLETQVTGEEYRSQALEEYLRSRLESPQGWQDWVSTTTAESGFSVTAPAKGTTVPGPAQAPPASPGTASRFSDE